MSTPTAAQPTFGEANFAEAQLGDIRRTRRLVSLADALRRHPGGSLPNKLPSPRNLKALYRLCSRKEVTHQAVLAPHRAHTQRLWVEHDTVLILHDSTELDYSKRKSLADLGDIGGPGRHRGYICHNSLAVLPEDGSVLGLFNQILHKRVKPPKRETKTQLRNRKSRMSRLWLEGVATLPADRRLVDVCDRGADTFEFLEHELASGRRFVVRSSHSRRLVPHSSSIAELFLHAHLRAQRAWGRYVLKVRAHDGMPARKARLSVSAVEVRLIPPRAKKGHHGNEPLAVWAVRVWEPNPPKGQKPLEWFLLTNEPLASFTDAQRVVRWYERRWVIEEFHKGMKTGCQVEGLQFTAEERLQPAIALLSIVALTLLQLRDASRQPDADTKPASDLFSRAYIDVLSGWRYNQAGQDMSVSSFFLALGRLGGHQNRKRDGRPGWLTLWRGWTKLQIMVEGVRALNRKKCG
jgi:hypothetical protein